jgi:hypothetical protein
MDDSSTQKLWNYYYPSREEKCDPGNCSSTTWNNRLNIMQSICPDDNCKKL